MVYAGDPSLWSDPCRPNLGVSPGVHTQPSDIKFLSSLPSTVSWPFPRILGRTPIPAPSCNLLRLILPQRPSNEKERAKLMGVPSMFFSLTYQSQCPPPLGFWVPVHPLLWHHAGLSGKEPKGKKHSRKQAGDSLHFLSIWDLFSAPQTKIGGLSWSFLSISAAYFWVSG